MTDADDDVITVARDYVMFRDYTKWTGVDGQGFSHPRLAEYRELFDQVGTDSIHRSADDKNIVRIAASVLVKEIEDQYSIVLDKGYAYAHVEPSPLVDSLDNLGFDSKGTFYRRLSGNWFLYHQWSVAKPE